jgi:hypothetical protein
MVQEQCGFRKGRSCTDAIFTVQQIIEKRKEHNLPLFLLFTDYEKPYNVNRDKMWEMKMVIKKGIQLNNSKLVNTML